MIVTIYPSIKKPLISLITLICCIYSGLLLAQDAVKDTEGDTADDEKTMLAKDLKPTRIPSSQQRLQFPSNNGGDKGPMGVLAKQISSGLFIELAKDAIVWLETTANEKFLSMWQPDRSGNPRGALLIIHSEGENLAWPNTIWPLQETLPDYGWATLALSLPEPAKPQIPKRTLAVKTQTLAKGDDSANSQDESTDKKKPETMVAKKEITKEEAEKKELAQSNATDKNKVEPEIANTENNDRLSPEEITEQRLETALRFLHDKGQFNIVILGNGTGAIRANVFLNNTTPKIDNPALGSAKPFRGIILLNSRNRLPIMEQDYRDWFNDPAIPVLDIFLAQDVRNQKAAKARKIIAKQKKVSVYKQVKLNHLKHTPSGHENILSRRIRSYLSANATGVEANAIKTAEIN
jgi:hypothetical protein